MTKHVAANTRSGTIGKLPLHTRDQSIASGVENVEVVAVFLKTDIVCSRVDGLDIASQKAGISSVCVVHFPSCRVRPGGRDNCTNTRAAKSTSNLRTVRIPLFVGVDTARRIGGR